MSAPSTDDFYAMNEETQYTTVRDLSDVDRKTLRAALRVEGGTEGTAVAFVGREHPYLRALRACELMDSSVTPGHPYWAERVALVQEYAKQAAHRAWLVAARAAGVDIVEGK